jgi:hypothetical protein
MVFFEAETVNGHPYTLSTENGFMWAETKHQGKVFLFMLNGWDDEQNGAKACLINYRRGRRIIHLRKEAFNQLTELAARHEKEMANPLDYVELDTSILY